MTPERARRYFLEQLSKYGEIDCYWSGDRLVTRSVRVSVHYPTKPQCIFLGRYEYPFDGKAFLDDLQFALERWKSPP